MFPKIIFCLEKLYVENETQLTRTFCEIRVHKRVFRFYF